MQHMRSKNANNIWIKLNGWDLPLMGFRMAGTISARLSSTSKISFISLSDIFHNAIFAVLYFCLKIFTFLILFQYQGLVLFAVPIQFGHLISSTYFLLAKKLFNMWQTLLYYLSFTVLSKFTVQIHKFHSSIINMNTQSQSGAQLCIVWQISNVLYSISISNIKFLFLLNWRMIMR